MNMMEQQSSYLTTSFLRKDDPYNPSNSSAAMDPVVGPSCPLITNPSELSTPADKIKTVPCRQIPGSPDMSPVMKRRRTALAKKAMELQRDGKITRIRVVGSASVILEFCEAKELGEQSRKAGCAAEAKSTGTCRSAASDELWKRYKSPAMSRRQVQTNTRESALWTWLMTLSVQTTHSYSAIEPDTMLLITLTCLIPMDFWPYEIHALHRWFTYSRSFPYNGWSENSHALLRRFLILVYKLVHRDVDVTGMEV